MLVLRGPDQFIDLGAILRILPAVGNHIDKVATGAGGRFLHQFLEVGLRTKEQELKMLMDQAEQSTGGAIINVIAYQADYAKARDELKVLEATARSKNCTPKQ